MKFIINHDLCADRCRGNWLIRVNLINRRYPDQYHIPYHYIYKIIAKRINLYFSPLSLLCPNRYRFMELYYKTGEVVRKDRTIPARTETVVVFLPDIRCCVPTRVEWDSITSSYEQKLSTVLARSSNAISSSDSNKGSGSSKKTTETIPNITIDAKDDAKKIPDAIEEPSDIQTNAEINELSETISTEQGGDDDNYSTKDKALLNFCSLILSV